MSIFCDQTTVEFIAGKGGDGSVHFHREKFIDRGGPDGGDGGHGGSIILVADENLNTLVDYNTRKKFEAEDGGNGQKQNMHGKDGDDLILKIAAGTLVKDEKTGEILADLKTHHQTYTVVRGGRGGMGNIHFKSSTHKAPEFAENGEEGERKKVTLELQLVADIGIIGFPSAGKSTLISRISEAKPKIAAYPFTTLIPNLGVVNLSRFDKKQKDSFVVADIPGLIEGAHLGKGLGHEFLRHVSRTEVLVHLVDPTRGDVVNDYTMINHELQQYDPNLAKKEQIVAINKIDTLDEKTVKESIKKLVKANPKLKAKIFEISAINGENLKKLVYEMYKKLQVHRDKKAEILEGLPESPEGKVFRPHLETKKFVVSYVRNKLEASTQKERKIFDLTGHRIEQLIKMTDLENPEGLERVYHFMSKMGIRHELRRQGAQVGDKIRIAGKTIRMR